MFYDVAMNFVIGTILMVAGAIMLCIPNRVFTWILVVSILFLFANGVTLFIRFFKNKKNKDFFFSILSFAFMFFLMNFRYIPQWILRVNFGGYCILCGSACFIQLVIDKINHFKGKFFNFVFTIIYILFGFYLLLNPNFHTDLLMQAFGIYFMILGLRYLGDGYVGINPLTKYKWKRKVRITLPAFLCALVPDAALASINRYLEEGKPEDLNTYKMEDSVRLKVIVHVGPKGFQKVGHICFSYDNIVYSYGNYDSDSFRLNQTIGDGIFFTVPLEKYIPNMISAENNSIFEYGILTTPKQNAFIEKEIEKIRLNGYRWYTKIEKEDGYDHFSKYEMDYPSRLHYRTGAKLYKVKSGKFHIYWALGDNCASFTDLVLRTLGADVLSIRGIISPGTYLDWLQKEYLKKNSPIVSRCIYTKETVEQ